MITTFWFQKESHSSRLEIRPHFSEDYSFSQKRIQIALENNNNSAHKHQKFL